MKSACFLRPEIIKIDLISLFHLSYPIFYEISVVISSVMKTMSVFRPECFVTELAGVREALHVNLHVFFYVEYSVALVITNFAVIHAVSSVYKFIKFVISFGRCHGLIS